MSLTVPSVLTLSILISIFISILIWWILRNYLDPSRSRKKINKEQITVMTSNIPAAAFTSKKNTSWVVDAPFAQPYYRFEDGSWLAVSEENEKNPSSSLPSKLSLITWNIDALVPYADERMQSGLAYLNKLYVESLDKAPVVPVVIFLQEMLPDDLAQIQEADWVRENFYITDTTPEFWESTFYGTTTLIDKRLEVERVFRVHYGNTRMQRDGLFVDVGVRIEETTETKVLRLCNTHLESLVSNPPRRPIQLQLASTYMHGSNQQPSSSYPEGLPQPHASILAGDLNAFAPEDRTAPTTCNLQDAFLVLGGKEDTDEGYTWGQQVPEETRKQFGCSRMDKVLFCGGLKAAGIERIGKGIMAKFKVEYLDEDDQEQTEDMEVWVTDHLGLMVDFTVTDL